MDLNHRPLGYEGKTVRHPIQTWQAKSKKILERESLLLPRFARFHTLFTDKKRTICATPKVSECGPRSQNLRSPDEIIQTISLPGGSLSPKFLLNHPTGIRQHAILVRDSRH